MPPTPPPIPIINSYPAHDAWRPTELRNMLLKSEHSNDKSKSSARGLYYVIFKDKRPVKLLEVSWAAFEDAFRASKIDGVLPCKLTRESVYPNAAELMSRELALQALCNETLNFMRRLWEQRPSAYRSDPTGTIELASLMLEFDTCISSRGAYAPSSPEHHNIKRAKEIYQELVATDQVLYDMWSTDNRQLFDWVSPNIKKVKALSISAQTLHACANAVFAHEEVLHECKCRCPHFKGHVEYGESGT